MLTDNQNAALVLVVEADVSHVELIQRSFDSHQEEYQLEIVGTLLEARKIIEKDLPALVLADYRLPDGDGNELVVMVNDICPVIIMTSIGNEEAGAHAMKIGAHDYIVTSPEKFQELPQTVKYSLMSWALQKARRQVEDANIRAKSDWERTFDAMPDLIAIIDSSHTITRANKAMAERCGVSQGALVGRTCCEVIHGLAHVPADCPGVAMMQDGRVHSIEAHEKKLCGFYDVTVSPLFDDCGQITSFVQVMRDISEQKKTEDLVRLRLKLSDMVSTSSVYDLMGATVDACEQLTESSIGFFHLVDEDEYRKGLPSGHASILRELTVPFIQNDTVIAIVGVGNKAIPYTDHDVFIVTQFLAFASEVIGRKKAIIALEESEEKHRKLAHLQQIILNASSVGICFLKDGKIIWVNPAFEQMFGYEPGTLFVTDTAELYPDKEAYEQVGEQGYSAIDAGSIYSRDLLMKKKDGTLIWCNLVGQAVTPGNAKDGSIWIVLDISERKRAEEDRLALEGKFQQTQKLESLGVLAGGIAHDFNNILTIIMGHCYLVMEEMEPGNELIEHVRLIEKAAIRASELCRQMLSYAGKNVQIKTRINLFLMIEENVKMLQAVIAKNVTIEQDLTYNVPEISGDSAQIQQVVMNLIINASEAIGDRNGTIKIGLEKLVVSDNQMITDYGGTTIQAGNYTCLTVTDNGCGMDPETQGRIFEPFYTTKFTGRGLGMSAVLGIIKTHDGTLKLSSMPGAGTTITVFFPETGTADGPHTTPEAELRTVQMGQGTILLVDDEESLRIIGSALLYAMGFVVMAAAHGREALDLFQENGSGIDLVLLDLDMPVLGGSETYAQLRELSPEIPIVICSGGNAEVIIENINNDEHASIIMKPYVPDQLRTVLMKHIGKTE